MMKPLTKDQSKFLKMLRDYFAGTEFESKFGNLSLYLASYADESLLDLELPGTPASQNRRLFPLPVQGKVLDDDGEVIFLWPFFDENSHLAQIEIWKPSGSVILNDPFSRDIELEGT
jgi:hypothetical protein